MQRAQATAQQVNTELSYNISKRQEYTFHNCSMQQPTASSHRTTLTSQKTALVHSLPTGDVPPPERHGRRSKRKDRSHSTPQEEDDSDKHDHCLNQISQLRRLGPNRSCTEPALTALTILAGASTTTPAPASNSQITDRVQCEFLVILCIKIEM